MGIQTTCIGAYTKPDYINIGNWSESEAAATGDPETRGFTYMSAALEHIDRGRLVAAPDCGLMMLDRDLAMQKLRNLSVAAKLI